MKKTLASLFLVISLFVPIYMVQAASFHFFGGKTIFLGGRTILGFLGLAAATPVTPALIAHTYCTYTDADSGCTTASIDTTGANFLVIVVSRYGFGSGFSLTDNKSNTWTPATQYDVSGLDPIVQIYYVPAATVGSGHTFTLSGLQQYGTIEVAAFSGVNTSSPLDKESGNSAINASSLTPGSVTTTTNGELIIQAMGGYPMTNITQESSPAFTLLEEHHENVSATYATGMAYYIQPSAGGSNPGWTWTQTSSTNAVVSQGTFKSQ